MTFSGARGTARWCGTVLAVLVVGLALAPGRGATATRGRELWVARYNGPGDGDDVAKSLSVSADGSRVFVTGYSDGGLSHEDYATAAYAASSGQLLWARRYTGPGSREDIAFSVGTSPQGSAVFVTGSSDRGDPNDVDYATLAYDAVTGATRWVRLYSGPGGGPDRALSLAASPDGSQVFVTGSSYRWPASTDYTTIAYASGTGSVSWMTRYDGPVGGADTAYSVAASPDGSKVFVTGISDGGTSDYDAATAAYSASTGVQLWAGRYNGPGNDLDEALAVAASPDGSMVFVTGDSIGVLTGVDYATVAYDSSSGTELWVSRYAGPGNGFDAAYSVAVSPDGSKVFVTGGSDATNGLDDWATVAHDAATGATLWIKRYNGPLNGIDTAYSVAVSPDGSRVFVTGFSCGKAADYTTVAYNAATGATEWVRRYDGGQQDDAANFVAASADGSKVFVTGGSSRRIGNEDYVTLAYGTG